MQYPATIVVLLSEGQEGVNIARRAVGLRNQKGLTEHTIAVGSAEEVILNSDGRYRQNRE
jgi:hypothetical protein